MPIEVGEVLSMPENRTPSETEGPTVLTPSDFYKEVAGFSNEYQEWHEKQIEHAKEQGRQLGSTNVPHEDETAPTPYEGQLRGLYQHHLPIIATN